MKIAIYSRKSKFTGKGDSIENQIKECDKYIKEHFNDVTDKDIAIFEDEGYSGGNTTRPQFRKMMQQIKENRFEKLIVYRLDRISRNVFDFTNLLKELQEHNVTFISTSEPHINTENMLLMYISIVFADFERSVISERIRDNMLYMAKSGKWLGGTTPLGYKSEKITSKDSNGKERSYYKLVYDEEQLSIVKTIFSKYSQLHSINAVESYLREHKINTQKNNEWDKSNVKRILTNPIYCAADKESYDYFTALGCIVCFTEDDFTKNQGILAYNRTHNGKINPYEDWVIATSTHKPILSGTEWVRVQSLIDEGGKNAFGGKNNDRKPINPNSLLSGVLHCKCGAYMRPKKYASGKMYYLCEKKEKTHKKECNCQNVNGDILDKLVLDELFAFDIEGSNVNYQIHELKKQIDDSDNEIAKDILKLKKQKTDNESQMQNLILSLSMNPSSLLVEMINKQIAELTELNISIDSQIKDLSERGIIKSSLELTINTLEKAIQYLKDNFDKLSIQNKREFIKQIVDKIVYDGENVNIFIKGSAE